MDNHVSKVPLTCGTPVSHRTRRVKNLKNEKSFSFVRFQYVLHDSEALSQSFQNFLQLTRGNLISWGRREDNSAERLNYLKDAISILLISFQCILHESGVLFSVF